MCRNLYIPWASCPFVHYPISWMRSQSIDRIRNFQRLQFIGKARLWPGRLHSQPLSCAAYPRNYKIWIAECRCQSNTVVTDVFSRSRGNLTDWGNQETSMARTTDTERVYRWDYRLDLPPAPFHCLSLCGYSVFIIVSLYLPMSKIHSIYIQ